MGHEQHDVVGPGRVAVVTGGASGIGRALCEAFAAAGSSVVVADVADEQAHEVAARLRTSGADALAVPVDVADPASVQALAEQTLARHGQVDVLCNNAGVSTFNLVADQSLADWHWVFDVNLWGVVHGLQAFLPAMRQQGTPAHVVNTASMGGLMGGLAFIGPYAASKAAVISLSETLHQELALAGSPVGVSVLCPGSTDTAVTQAERNRPHERGAEVRSADAEAMRQAISDLISGPEALSAEAVAARTLEAIRAKQLWVLPAGSERPIVQARADQVLAAFPPD